MSKVPFYLNISRLITLGVLFCFIACNTAPSNKKYPSKPITYIVPWAPGGMTDLSSRMLAASLQKYLDVPVNVVNRTGGGGVVGHLALSRARPDGYTIGAVTGEITQMHHMGLTDLTYANYTPLALILNNPAGITVRADAPYQDINDLVNALRLNPGSLKCSGTARGGIWDLARLGFLQAAGLE
ncbi:MAG: tripartite tricarboxylate transporter substrate binding protein, partial [Saprospiraceae bacterium]|nr:tripartite tricarboxylate transporter substrate binding protein [Saprospiraceae bacterium]